MQHSTRAHSNMLNSHTHTNAPGSNLSAQTQVYLDTKTAQGDMLPNMPDSKPRAQDTNSPVNVARERLDSGNVRRVAHET